MIRQKSRRGIHLGWFLSGWLMLGLFFAVLLVGVVLLEELRNPQVDSIPLAMHLFKIGTLETSLIVYLAACFRTFFDLDRAK